MVKTQRKFIVVAVATLFLSLISTPISTADNPPRKIMTGWVPYYSMKTALPDVLNNIDLIKEVMPFWYTLKFDGKAKAAVVTDLYAPANPSVPISEPLTAMRNAGLSIIPTITDGTDKLVLAGLLKNPASRTQVVSAIMNLVRANNYDGIDIDFEGFAFVDGNSTWTSTAPSWVAFIKELSIALRAEKKLLSVSTPYVLNPNEAQKGYFVYAWAAIASSIDKLRIMTYDYSVSKVGPMGPITWAERTVQYAVSVMPASKVFVGVPGYGRDWVTAVTGVCPANVVNSVKPGAKAATFVMRDAVALAATYGTVPRYDEKFGEMTFSYQKVYNGTTATGLATSCTASRTAWYQDARGWALRAALVTKYRIGGITAWTFGMEEPLAMESIRQVAKEIAPDQVAVTAAIDNSTIDYGNPITVTATFTIKDKSPVAGVPVRIEGKSAGDTNWRTLATVTTGIDGKIEKAVLVGKSTAVRVYSDSTWERTEGASSEFPIVVNRLLVISAPGTAKSSVAKVITGNIRPRIAGASVQLEKLVGKEWKPLDVAVLTDAQGNFSLNLSGQTRGVSSFRISVAADSLWSAVLSPIFNIIIR
ncbi:putative glycosyl hydrolase [Candidatus Planktophila dulcis]|uniref:glycosyl hydrolase family 18 protein n=1 Tax=Candidatus Planktophila dulcis TaxID=1884914 RepID=UPI000BACDBD6|nr:glycosyl hydrolase family 18 protein [Candidatus Planktophila dulcis]ASY20857.1 putative glycosyl hydrolase [Candidatus Planktophila dulcis]